MKDLNYRCKEKPVSNAGIRIMGFTLAGLLMFAIPSVRAQEPADEIKRLKDRLVELDSKIKFLEKQNELLKRELDQLRPSKNKNDNAPSNKPLDIITPGSILSGPYENLADGGIGEITVHVTERQIDTFRGNWTIKTDKGSESGELAGKINSRRLTWKSVNSRKGQATAAFLLIDDVLEGTWAASTGGNGPLSLKLAK